MSAPLNVLHSRVQFKRDGTRWRTRR